MLVATVLADEGRRGHANAERAKDAAEADRHGDPRRGGRDGMTVVANLLHQEHRAAYRSPR
jgi:hypothetical protein